MNEAKKIWEPTPAFVYHSNLNHYTEWLASWGYGIFDNYEDLWEWSVRYPEGFWKSLWIYFSVNSEYDAVLADDKMPGAQWFTGSRLNYAEYIFRDPPTDYPAIIHKTERSGIGVMRWDDLREEVARMRAFLRSKGVGQHDVVAAFVSNIPEATIMWLATISLGAIWTSCSPDFGVHSVVERFKQVKPKVLLAVNGYSYNNKPHDRLEEVYAIAESLEYVEAFVGIHFLAEGQRFNDNWTLWDDIPQTREPLIFDSLPFDHPMCVLYSSGTTGQPKAITHSHGGLLLEHLKYLTFHNDVHVGERFFWFSTTGWMMWNFVQASLLVGATAVLYDGSPSYPDLGAMWTFVEEAGIHHFGTSAPFLVACMKRNVIPKEMASIDHLRSIGSTGSPLPPEAFDYVYDSVHNEVWLTSMSGGTDVCTAFVGGCPHKPVCAGKIQCRALGVSLYAYDDNENPVRNEVGEMVINKPLPSMPIYFWDDPDYERYRSSYFDVFPGKWRHGDWISIDDEGQIVIYGRSDATLNRQGVRIGTSEIYRALDQIDAIQDALIVNLELEGGRHYMPLFITCSDDVWTDQLQDEIKKTLRETYSPRHVPDDIIRAEDIPYTISGKKMEAPVKRILLGHPTEKAINRDAMRNPECVAWYVQYAQRLRED